MKAGTIIIVLCFIGLPLFAQKEKPVIRKGNEFYESGKYTEAEVAYRKALEIKGDTYEGNFNLGNALIKQKKYDESLEQLQVLAGTEKDKAKLADVFHNLGNAYLESQKLKESIDAYKNALRNDPADNETRYNLAYAQRLLKEQEEQEQNQDQNKDQEDQEQKEQDKKDQDQKDQDQKDQQQKDQQQKDQQQQQDQKKDQQDQKEKQQQQQEQEVSKQMAEQLLKALEQDEKEIQEKVQLQKMQQAKSRKVEKDW